MSKILRCKDNHLAMDALNQVFDLSVEREEYKLKPNKWDASGKDCNPKRVK